MVLKSERVKYPRLYDKFMRDIKGLSYEKRVKKLRQAIDSKDYYKLHKEKVNNSTKKYQKLTCKQLRTEIIKLLGGKCVNCGYSDWRALQFDHVRNDGYKDRKAGFSGIKLLRRILISVKKHEGKYQLLCANCNYIKAYHSLDKFTK